MNTEPYDREMPEGRPSPYCDRNHSSSLTAKCKLLIGSPSLILGRTCEMLGGRKVTSALANVRSDGHSIAMRRGADLLPSNMQAHMAGAFEELWRRQTKSYDDAEGLLNQGAGNITSSQTGRFWSWFADTRGETWSLSCHALRVWMS